MSVDIGTRKTSGGRTVSDPPKGRGTLSPFEMAPRFRQMGVPLGNADIYPADQLMITGGSRLGITVTEVEASNG